MLQAVGAVRSVDGECPRKGDNMRADAYTRRKRMGYSAATLLAVALAACGGAAQAPHLGAPGHIALPVAMTPSKSAKMMKMEEEVVLSYPANCKPHSCPLV